MVRAEAHRPGGPTKGPALGIYFFFAIVWIAVCLNAWMFYGRLDIGVAIVAGFSFWPLLGAATVTRYGTFERLHWVDVSNGYSTTIRGRKAEEWCREHASGRWAVRGGMVFFGNEKDVMLYVLSEGR